MAKVRRFYYVRGPRSGVMHIAFSTIEGPTACGRYTEPGWAYWLKARGKLSVCKQCVASSATDQAISVQRVRKAA